MSLRGGSDRASVRWALYAGLVSVISLVSDGWSGKPSPVLHQVMLLPFSVLTGIMLYAVLRPAPCSPQISGESGGLPYRWPVPLVGFAIWSLLFVLAESRHFRAFGYRLTGAGCLIASSLAVAGWLGYCSNRSARGLLGGVLMTYGAAMLLAIVCFPLNYLRSDMLPVIGWADSRVLHHLNPYETMHVGTRLYDFPYLPGMLVAFLPASVFHLDLRWATLAYLIGAAVVVYFAAATEYRHAVVALLGLFLLCPFLEYRHDLYLQPHWFAVVVAVVLMQRRHFLWSGLVWGFSCGIYQLSWVIFPFVLLYAYRRGGLSEASKVLGLAATGAMLMCGPFLASASRNIASNTVGQWSRLPHALADPMNVSYWLTFFIHPDQLKFVQAGLLTALFFYCVVTDRCRTLADGLRWMCVALAVFIPLNVLVDGYFYLTLLLVILLYICAENGWWSERDEVPVLTS